MLIRIGLSDLDQIPSNSCTDCMAKNFIPYDAPELPSSLDEVGLDFSVDDGLWLVHGLILLVLLVYRSASVQSSLLR